MALPNHLKVEHLSDCQCEIYHAVFIVNNTHNLSTIDHEVSVRPENLNIP